MKVKVLFLVCSIFCLNLYAQTDDLVHVEDLYLARDDGNGNAGEITSSFFIKDIPIHCVVQLDSLKPVTVKMVFVAVKVTGVKPETKVITSKYKTNGEQSEVSFTGKPDKIWFAGNYRIDIFIDEKQAKSIEFEIQRSTKQTQEVNAVSPKPKMKGLKKSKKG